MSEITASNLYWDGKNLCVECADGTTHIFEEAEIIGHHTEVTGGSVEVMPCTFTAVYDARK